jgi:hypothetical protein
MFNLSLNVLWQSRPLPGGFFFNVEELVLKFLAHYIMVCSKELV